jgi:class 3 adenylate cyclase
MSTGEGGIVAFLFTDIVGSTQMLESLGEDRAHEVRREHFALLRDVLGAAGGHEVKSLGDGLMVTFPSVVAALTCAIEMQQVIDRRSRRPGPPGPRLRIGLNVGEPVLDEADYFGAAVVVAKRLCDQASGGQILASAVVQALAGHRAEFEFTRFGALTLKGFAEPVDAWELAWTPGVEVEVALPPVLAAPAREAFVGRDHELDQLRAAWQRAQAGERQVVFVAGEPGIGKTRLSAEVARLAHRAGGTVLFGRCDEETLAPYQPFVEALYQYAVACGPHRLRAEVGEWGGELARLVPELGKRLPDAGEPVSGEPEIERYRMFEAVASVLARAAEAAPLLLLLDDLHWADKGSLLLLRHLIRRPEQSSLMILATYRDTDISRRDPLAETLADLRRDAPYERISLRGLAEQEVVSLIQSFGTEEESEETVKLAATLEQQTEGNPFFITEILRHLRDTGVIYRVAGGWTSDRAVDQLAIPEGVKEVVGRRLSSLSETANQALTVGSVAGREFDVELLERVTGLAPESLLAALEEALHARLISETPAVIGRYGFAHAIVREALYDELSTARRLRLHKRIGGALEELHAGEIEAYLPAIARHYLEAAPTGDAERAIDYALRAARLALYQTAYEEAAGHCEAALEVVDFAEQPEELRATLLLALGDARWRAGDAAPAQKAYADSIAVARVRNDPELFARAVLGLAGAGVRAWWVKIGVVDEQLIAYLEEALAGLPGGDSEMRARLLACLAQELYFVPRSLARRAALRTEAVAMARRVGDGATLGYVMYTSILANYTPELFEEPGIGDLANEMQTLAEQLADPELMAVKHLALAAIAMNRGDMAAVDAEIAGHARLADQTRQPMHQAMLAVYRAMRAHVDGRFAEAEQFAREGFRLSQAAHDANALLVFALQTGMAHYEMGHFDQLEPALRGLAAEYPQLPAWRTQLATNRALQGDVEEARVEFEALVERDFATLPRDFTWTIGICQLAEACARLGDIRRAATLYELLLPFARRTVSIGPIACQGLTSMYLGLLAGTMSRWEEAAGHFEDGLAMAQTMGAPAFAARTRCYFATMLLRRDLLGDRRRAEELAREATATAHQLGMTALADQAGALVAQAQGLAPTRPQVAAAPRRRWARAALATGGRSAIARLSHSGRDEDLERRFANPVALRAIFSAMCVGFQPSVALGFEGDIVIDLHRGDGERHAAGSWTIEVGPKRASARRGPAEDPAVTVHVSVADFIRLISGELSGIGGMAQGRVDVDGDVLLAARMVEMFGGLTPAELLAPVDPSS